MECPRQLATAEILTGDDPNDILPDLSSRDTGPPRLCREYYDTIHPRLTALPRTGVLLDLGG